MRLLKRLILVSLVGYSALLVPELHYSILRSYTVNKIVKLTDKALTSGGTGFHVKVPSGKTYIMTNAHVCGLKGKDGMIMVSQPGKTPILRKVIEESKYSDLCLVEPLEGITGLSVGKETIGKIVQVVGHPALQPPTLTKGELTGTEKVEVLESMFPEPGTCNLPKNKIIDVLFLKLCIVSINAYTSNINILGGNSGSPLVDNYGNLVGVAFAANKANWGFFITVSDIEKFLEIY